MNENKHVNESEDAHVNGIVKENDNVNENEHGKVDVT